MQFAIIAYDGTDEQALDRRLGAREAHIKLGDQLVANGQAIFGAAIMSDTDKMIGSIEIVDFSSREALDEYLETEPYVLGNVWEKIEVVPCKVGPSYEKLLNRD